MVAAQELGQLQVQARVLGQAMEPLQQEPSLLLVRRRHWLPAPICLWRQAVVRPLASASSTTPRCLPLCWPCRLLQ